MPDFKTLYCPKCERETTHEEVKNDLYFEFASMCLSCETIWQMASDWNESENNSEQGEF